MEIDLLELSAVPVPCNPNALQLSEGDYDAKSVSIIKQYAPTFFAAQVTDEKSGARLSKRTMEKLGVMADCMKSLGAAHGKLKAAHEALIADCDITGDEEEEPEEQPNESGAEKSASLGVIDIARLNITLLKQSLAQ